MSRAEKDRARDFVGLLASCEVQLSSYVLSLVPNFSDADEVLQETKIRLWEQFDEYDDTRPFGAWAISVARYQVLTQRQQLRRGRELFSGDLIELLHRDFRINADAQSARLDALRNCVMLLGGRSRSLLSGFYGKGQQASSLAESMGMSVAAVRKSLYRIRIQLKRCIESRLN